MNSINQRNLEIDKRKNDIIEAITQKILIPQLKREEITFSELKRKIDILDGTFSHVKKLFSWRERDNWEDAFIHQVEVVELLIQHSKNLSFEKVLILLEHDTIEDTDITISWMKESHKDHNIVFSVALMTKNPIIDFINNKEDKDILDQILQSWILNSKWNISDNFHDKLKSSTPLNKIEKNAYEEYQKLAKTYKSIRNKKYSENMQTIEGFFNHALIINKNHWFNINIEQIQINIINALECKLIDRLHWISTLWNCDTDKIERKIDETYIYYKEISIQFFPHLWKLIEVELERAKKILEFRKIHNITDNTKGQTNQVLENSQLTFPFDKDEK